MIPSTVSPALFLTLTALSGGEKEPDLFAACESRFASDPRSLEGCGCFYELAIEEGLHGAADKRLEEHLAADPENPCLQHNLGRLRFLSRDATAEMLLRGAAQGYAEAGYEAGEGYARLNLSRLLSRQGRRDAAWREHAAAAATLRSKDDRALEAAVELERARLMLDESADLEEIARVLLDVETKAGSSGSASLQRSTLTTLGNVHYGLGQFSEAAECYERAAALTRLSGDLYGEASARYNAVVAYLAQGPTRATHEEALRRLRHTLELAMAAGQLYAEADGRLRLGKLLDGEEGRRELRASLELAERLGAVELIAGAKGALAVSLLTERPQQALELVDEAQSLALGSSHLASVPYGWSDRMQVVWATRPRSEALAEGLATLDLVEGLRDLQRAEIGRAQFFSVWTEVYYALSGRLLEPTENDSQAPDIGNAFTVTERMRGRVLLEAIGRPRAALGGEENPHRDLLSEKLRELVEINRRLLDPGLEEEARAKLLVRLTEVERQEAELLDLGERQVPGAVRRPKVEAASLEEIRAALASDEALLSFQVAPWRSVYGDFAGGSWLIVVTRETSEAHRLPGPSDLQGKPSSLQKRILRRDGSDAVGARRLYETLLERPLAQLPAGIRKLVMVSDGPLHRLPFATLLSEDGTPLGLRYQLSLVPSATLWLHWRKATRVTPEPGVTALANPVPAHGFLERLAKSKNSAWAGQARLRPLPHARKEARAAVRYVGGSAELRVGESASERWLKQIRGPFGVLHLATHALIDTRHPDRSAVVLSPGGAEEDGLLQPRDIEALDLDGDLVVLSSCQSASGTTLAGEGPLSLARAFFAAGAHTVIASLWPLRDDEAAALFERFYLHLGRGLTVTEALQTAQGDRMAGGAKASAWAGVAVFGTARLRSRLRKMASGRLFLHRRGFWCSR